jgi:catechol 2,3-dioxygenase-like lactoylglutathione lyase family enzyme
MNAPLVLNQVNLVVRDMAATRTFYERLGLTFKDGPPEWAAHHASAATPDGMRLEFDSAVFAKQWNPGWRESGVGNRAVLFFGVAAREDVDRVHGSVVAAGHRSQQAPVDAFWGARYAIVEDPDGNSIGIMSPMDRSKGFPPPAPPT